MLCVYTVYFWAVQLCRQIYPHRTFSIWDLAYGLLKIYRSMACSDDDPFPQPPKHRFWVHSVSVCSFFVLLCVDVYAPTMYAPQVTGFRKMPHWALSRYGWLPKILDVSYENCTRKLNPRVMYGGCLFASGGTVLWEKPRSLQPAPYPLCLLGRKKRQSQRSAKKTGCM